MATKSEPMVEVAEVPPAPSEIADEPVKVGRRNMSAHEADRHYRWDRREVLHKAYGTQSARKADKGAPRR